LWLEIRTGPDAGAAVELPADRPFVLGRQRGSDLVVRDARASRRHVELTPEGGGRWRLRDLGSANGTHVDGAQATEAVLEGGEDIRIGDVVIAVVLRPPAGAREVPRDTERTPAGATEAAPQLATHSMVRRLVEASARRSSRTALLAGVGALVAAVAVVAVLVGTGVLGGGEEDPVPQVVAEAAPATVLVATRRDDVLTGTGSGWVLDAAEGLVVTNAHVVNQGTAFAVTADGRTRPAELVAAAPCEDLALLRVEDSRGLETARLAPPGSVRQGETVVALGFPADAAAGDSVGSTRGVVSSAGTRFRDPAPDVPAYPDVLQTDTPLNPGNSGGPLVDLDARVVGVNSAARTTGSDGRALQNVNYAIAIDHARPVLADLRAGRARAWTGLAFGYPTDAELRRERLPAGLRVTGVHAGTAAARSGVRPGDLVVAVDGTPIRNTLQSFCDVAGDRVSGDEVVLSLDRPGTSLTRPVRLRLD
jgi:S1-C subfamily serine protease